MRAWFDGSRWCCASEGSGTLNDPGYVFMSGTTLRDAIDLHNRVCPSRQMSYDGYGEFLDLTPAECLASTDPRLQEMVRWQSGDTGNCVHAVLLGGANDRFSGKTREEFEAAHNELAAKMGEVAAKMRGGA